VADIGVETDFAMHSGDDRILQYTVVDEDDAVVDITGATFTFELSKYDDTKPTGIGAPKGSPLFTKTVGSGITLITPASGRVDVALLPADTADLKGDHYHELEMVLSGVTSTVAFGKLTIHKDLVE
jgi:hypothetical protein